jgi:hypothetical protein
MGNNTYKYKRFMRDGTVEERTGVVRSKKKVKTTKEKDNGNASPTS